MSYLHTGVGSANETDAGILDLHYDAMSVSLAEVEAGVNGGLVVPVKYGTLTTWASIGGEVAGPVERPRPCMSLWPMLLV